MARFDRKNKFEKLRLKRESDDNSLSGLSSAPDNSDSEHVTEEATLDNYTSIISSSTDGRLLEKDIEIEELNKQILHLTQEKSNLEDELKRLRADNESLKQRVSSASFEEIERYKTIIAELGNEKNELSLKNSNLNVEIGMCKESIKNLQSKVDSFNHTYTQSGYQNRGNRTGGFVPSMNGYQDWK